MDNTFYSIIRHLHSLLRWFLIGMLLASLVISLIHLLRKKGLNPQGLQVARLAFITAHLQLLAGLVLYFISPKVVFSAASMQSPILRFYLVEHLLLMVIAIVLITTGYIRMKKRIHTDFAARPVFWYYLVALILLLFAIPWPFTTYGGAWF